MERLQKMIEAAEAKMIATNSRYQTAEDGQFQVYLTPVEQRTRRMKAHCRVGYYMNLDGQSWSRVSKAFFIRSMEAD